MTSIMALNASIRSRPLGLRQSGRWRFPGSGGV